MVNDKSVFSVIFLFGFFTGVVFMVAISMVNYAAMRDSVIESYKAGEIICAELGSELVCREQE